MTRKLLILNYAMDESDSIFSHQIQAVKALSYYFDEITVLTGHKGDIELASHINVISTGWIPGSKLRNVIRYYMKVIPLLFNPKVQIFSHMTEVQSALIAPLTRLLGIRHFLWYAHISNSFYLKWCHFWISGIITSTNGSCPLASDKVFVIGQGIAPEDFPVVPLRAESKKGEFLHFGRFDPSKNIEMVIKTCSILREKGFDVKFRQIGSASTFEYAKIAENLQKEYSSEKWVSFSPSIVRSQIPVLTQDYSAFIHAFTGSLDKTLVEATMQELPVITINPEYVAIFGSWTGDLKPNLLGECEYFLTADIHDIRKEVDRRRKIAIRSHSLENWVLSINHLFE